MICKKERIQPDFHTPGQLGESLCERELQISYGNEEKTAEAHSAFLALLLRENPVLTQVLRKLNKASSQLGMVYTNT